jgi:spermidine synthase
MARKNAILAALFALGFLSIGTQIYLIREVMSQLGDNELSIGIVLGIWMILTGAGAALSRSARLNSASLRLVPVLLVVTGILPLFQIGGLSLLKTLIIPFGTMAGPAEILVIMILTSLPFGLLNGYLFALLSASGQGITPGNAYSWDTLGSMVSGAMINFMLLWVAGVFVSILILQGIYLAMVLSYVLISGTRSQFMFLAAISVFYLVTAAVIRPYEWLEKINFPGQKVISDTETPYGRVVISQQSGQLNFYENGMLLFSSGNAISNEENVHYAMIQNPAPGNVLLISGGFAGTLKEILKYTPDRIDYFEMNPALITIATRYTLQHTHPAVRIHAADARKFIRHITGQYDIVLVNLPPPSTLQLNRYYSVEFINEAKKAMKHGGVIALSLPGGADYLSKRDMDGATLLRRTLGACFSNVIIIPGNKNYFIASDNSLSLRIPSMIAQSGISTQYVNRYYLDEDHLIARADRIMQLLTERAGEQVDGKEKPVNTDTTPVAVWHQLSWWLGFHQTSLLWILMIFGLVLLLMILTLNPVSAGLFTGSFTLMSLEIMLILGIQVITGYLFQVIGTLIMFFMLGLAAGAGRTGVPGLKSTTGGYALLQLVLALCALSIPFVIIWLSEHHAGDSPSLLTFIFLAFLVSYIVGNEYRIASFLSTFRGQLVITTNYSAEMFGAAVGAMAASMFLLPLFGMIKTGLLLAFINLISAGALLVRQKSHS